jgi:hypothetical protein
MDAMQAESRTPLVALAVLVVIFVPVVLVLVLRDGEAAREQRPAPGLRLEGAPGEITVYLDDRKLNRAATAGGARQVTLECVDTNSVVVYSAPVAWPFLDTDAGSVEPHAHVGMPPETINEVARCGLQGTEPLLEGRRP